MAEKDFGKLSPEQVRELSRTINDAKMLINQQAEIIEKVIAGEIEVGKLRISYLDEYLDNYSKGLDLIARKHSTLNDAFLILDHKINDGYKRVITEGSKAVAKLANDAEEAIRAQQKAKNTETKTQDRLENGPTDSRPIRVSNQKPANEPNNDQGNTRELLDVLLDQNNVEEPGAGARNKPGTSSSTNSSKKYTVSTRRYNSRPQVETYQATQGSTVEQQIKEATRRTDTSSNAMELASGTAWQRANGTNRTANRASEFVPAHGIAINTAGVPANNEYIQGLSANQAAIAQVPNEPATTNTNELQLEAQQQDRQLQQYTEHSNKVAEVIAYITELELSRYKLEKDEISFVTDLLLKKFREIASAANAKDGSANTTANSASSETSPLADNNGTVPPGGSSGEGKNDKNSSSVYTNVSPEKQDEMNRATLAESINFIDKIFAALTENTDEATRNAIIAENNAAIQIADLKAYQLEKETEQINELAAKKDQLSNRLMSLEIARHEEESGYINRVTDLKLTKLQEATDAELKAQNLLNSIQAEQVYIAENLQEAGEIRAKEAKAAADTKTLQELEEARVKYIAKKELEAKRKNNGVLTAEESAKIQKQAAEKYKLDQKNLESLTKRQAQLDAAKTLSAERSEIRSTTNNLFVAGSFVERKQAFYDLTHDASGNKDIGKAISATILAVSDLAKKLEVTIDEIAKNKGAIDTRLRGSSNKTTASGSYWDQITKDITSVGAINPYFKQEDFTKNIKALVEKGIAFDIEQRAFLMTIQEKIANTFNVADGTLLRLIRIQQEDSTAGRLGMEASLNAFLNEMYETTEYLTDVAASVRSSLEEMESLMSGAEATEVEYQVQKWLGSLYSVGMSQSAVNSISQTLGQIASGQIDGLTGGGAGNLLVMAANDAGLSIADILTEGLDASNTNKLMESVVTYLAEIAESSKDNNVVQQQLASVFGVKASDLRAATNLTSKSSVGAISSNYMQYNDMLNELFTMAGSMGSRTSLSEMMSNIWENGKYSLAGGVASSPAAYFIYKAATLLDDTVGGIDLPFINIFGSGVDLNTSVSELMRVGALGTGILGSIGPMLSGLANSFSGKKMLKQLGITADDSGLAITPRGNYTGRNIGSTGEHVSESGYIGNASGSDIKNTTLQEADSTKRQLMVEAKEEEEANQVNVLNTTVLKIYELLDDVAHGNSYFRVKVEGYGLTRASSSSNTLGGVNALSGLSDSSAGATSSYNGTNGVGVNSSSVTGSVDFGGWTTVM